MKLSTVVKAVRLHYAVALVLLLAVAYWLVIHPWMTNWGSTAVEQEMALPGDDLNPDRSGQSTLAITINAPPDVVWQWLVQVGQDRAGFYSYTWLENLIGADIHNADEIHPEWQHLAVGDSWRLAPADYLWGLGKEAVSPVLISEPGHVLALGTFGSHVIVPLDEHSSRLIVRSPAGPASLMTAMVMDPIVFTMERRMLFGLKARAEGSAEAPAALMAMAQLGWAAAGISVAYLFMSQRRRRYWLVLPLAATLPALAASSDVQSALAAFLAAGISVLGFLIFGRSWWGSLLVIGSVVMLTLLLALDAYIAIGLAFTLLHMAALGAMIAVRASGGAVLAPAQR